MVSLSGSDSLLAALHTARNITFAAYFLPDGAVRTALEDAARRGASVHVRLEAHPYTPGFDSAALNKQAIDALKKFGADARAVSEQDRALHIKAAVCDGVAYFDDRNWVEHGMQTVLRDDSPIDARRVLDTVLRDDAGTGKRFSTIKYDGLCKEAALLRHAHRGDTVEVSSESFSGSPVSAALRAAVRRGVHCKLVVGLQKQMKKSTVTLLRHLADEGVGVRIAKTAEKFAVVNGTNAWAGSANATYGYAQERDWSIRTNDARIAHSLRSHFTTAWREGKSV